MGITRFVVSGTAAAVGDHAQAKADLKQTMELAPDAALPLLWVAPDMLRNDPTLSHSLSALPYRGIKIHGRAHRWAPEGRSLRRVLAIARERPLPVLMPTGGDAACDAGAYRSLIIASRGATIILAHGRPVDQAIGVLKACPGCWVDTAFMPVQDLDLLVAEGFSGKILFGSDTPIDRVYRVGSPGRRYRSRIEMIKRRYGEQCFHQWAWLNNHHVWQELA